MPATQKNKMDSSGSVESGLAPAEVPKKPRKPRAKVTAYTRLAKAFKDEGSHYLARQCLEASERRSTGSDDPERSTKRQRLESNESSGVCSIARLPEEILVMILQHVPSSHVVSSTCRTWRQLMLNDPSRWRQLTLREEISPALCLEAVDTYTRRSNATMEAIELFDGFLQGKSQQLFDILLKNAVTLRHIKIADIFQRNCYDHLYRHCPNLKSLDVVNGIEVVRTACIPATQDFLVVHTEDDSPFQLEVFKGWGGFPTCSKVLEPGSSDWRNYGEIFPYMGNLRVIHGMDNPAWQRHQRLRFLEGLVDLRDTLEELVFFRTDRLEPALDDLESERSYEHWPTTVVFKRLKFLGGFNTVHKSCFEFPALEEAVDIKYDKDEHYRGYDTPSISSFFEQNMQLRKLDYDATFCEESMLYELSSALSQLDLLEDLTVTLRVDRSRWDAKFENIIAPVKSKTEGGPWRVPCPRLTRLSIQYKFQSIGALIFALAQRKRLAVGYVFDHTRDRNYSPIAQGTIAAEPPAPATALAERVESSRLKSIELCKITTPDGAVDLLHEFADSVTFRAKPIQRLPR